MSRPGEQARRVSGPGQGAGLARDRDPWPSSMPPGPSMGARIRIMRRIGVEVSLESIFGSVWIISLRPGTLCFKAWQARNGPGTVQEQARNASQGAPCLALPPVPCPALPAKNGPGTVPEQARNGHPACLWDRAPAQGTTGEPTGSASRNAVLFH